MRKASRLQLLGTETAFEVLAEVKRLEAQGRDIISFAIGEPDFATPQNIKDAGCQAIQEDHTHYSPSAGLMELREAIAEYVSATRKISVSPEEVVVTPGAKPIIFHGILACVDPGDEVIYPNPGFPIYESVIRFVGGVPVPLPLREERDFRFDIAELQSLVTPRTKMIIINSPHNPTGGILGPKELEAVAELALTHDLWVLSDEIYSRLVFEGEFLSITAIPEMKERTIILDGFSKTYAMTGWRLGYGVMNRSLAQDVARLVTNCESCTATFTQVAGIEALRGPQDGAEAMREEFLRRRNLIVKLLNEIDGISCRIPQGAFYVFPNVTEACRKLGLKDAREFQRKALYEANVAVLSRTSFGSKGGWETQEYVRLSYATSMEQIKAGIERLRKFVEG